MSLKRKTQRKKRRKGKRKKEDEKRNSFISISPQHGVEAFGENSIEEKEWEKKGAEKSSGKAAKKQKSASMIKNVEFRPTYH